MTFFNFKTCFDFVVESKKCGNFLKDNDLLSAVLTFFLLVCHFMSGQGQGLT